jgi:hypothetical protein
LHHATQPVTFGFVKQPRWEAVMRSRDLELNVEVTFEEILADLLYPAGS